MEDLQLIIEDIGDVEALIEHEIADAEVQEGDDPDVAESSDGGNTEESDDDTVDTVGTGDDSSDDEEAGQEPEVAEGEADILSRKQAAFERKVEEIEAV